MIGLGRPSKKPLLSSSSAVVVVAPPEMLLAEDPRDEGDTSRLSFDGVIGSPVAGSEARTGFFFLSDVARLLQKIAGKPHKHTNTKSA